MTDELNRSSEPDRRGYTRTLQPQNPEETDPTRTQQSTRTKPTRRRFLQLTGSGVTIVLAGSMNSDSSSGGDKQPKDAVQYQDQPQNGQQCSTCRYYNPPEDGDKTGTCQLVTGKIEPDDWCSLYG